MNVGYKERIRYEIQKELARRNYTDYCKFVNGKRWLLGKHVKLVCEMVEKLINREVKENILIISMPP